MATSARETKKTSIGWIAPVRLRSGTPGKSQSGGHRRCDRDLAAAGQHGVVRDLETHLRVLRRWIV